MFSVLAKQCTCGQLHWRTAAYSLPKVPTCHSFTANYILNRKNVSSHGFLIVNTCTSFVSFWDPQCIRRFGKHFGSHRLSLSKRSLVSFRRNSSAKLIICVYRLPFPFVLVRKRKLGRASPNRIHYNVLERILPSLVAESLQFSSLETPSSSISAHH